MGMKLLALPLAVFFSASVMSAQSTTTTSSPTTTTPTTGTTNTTTPTTPTTPAAPNATTSPAGPAKKAAPKKEAEPVIPGVTVPRANGTFFGLELAGGKFKITCYDKKKKPMAPDVSRIAARWPNTRSAEVAWNRTILNPEGNALIGAATVYPPYAWNVFLTVLEGQGDDTKATENYVVPFHM